MICLIPSPCCVTQRCISTSNRSHRKGKRLRLSTKGRVSLHEEIELISWFVKRENDHTRLHSIPQSTFDFTEQVHSLLKDSLIFRYCINIVLMLLFHFYLCVSVCVSGFMSTMQRNQSGSQFASPQSGPPMSPHPSPGGPLYSGMGPYSQSGPSGPYGPQGSQYGHQGESMWTNVT